VKSVIYRPGRLRNAREISTRVGAVLASTRARLLVEGDIPRAFPSASVRGFRRRTAVSIAINDRLFVSHTERGDVDVSRGEEPGGRDQGLAVLARQAAFRQATDSRCW